jgi:hypothetical protein
MANKIITVFFTNRNTPELGLTPTIDIWELDPLVPTTNTLIINDDTLTEVGGGFYRYDFATYDANKDYSFVIDGGAGLPSAERYHVGANESYAQEIVDNTWNAESIDYLAGGSMGEKLSLIHADTTQIRIDAASCNSLLTTLLKYERNRTRIDKTAFTLTIFDDDGVTPLKVFDLKDSAGNPSIIEVCERIPQ